MYDRLLKVPVIHMTGYKSCRLSVLRELEQYGARGYKAHDYTRLGRHQANNKARVFVAGA